MIRVPKLPQVRPKLPKLPETRSHQYQLLSMTAQFLGRQFRPNCPNWKILSLIKCLSLREV
jgi:hypothetical protein